MGTTRSWSWEWQTVAQRTKNRCQRPRSGGEFFQEGPSQPTIRFGGALEAPPVESKVEPKLQTHFWPQKSPENEMLQVYILLVLLHKLILQLKLERPVAPATLPGYTTG